MKGPSHSLLIRPDTADVALEIPLAAPAWLDPNTKCPLPDDPVHAAWQDVQEAFVHLQAQRTIELLRAMVAEMPAREKMTVEWEHDEWDTLWLGFSNGWWGADDRFSQPDVRFQRYSGEPKVAAPSWYPRTQEGTRRWDCWYGLLSRWSVDPTVSQKVWERLNQGLEQTGGIVSRAMLPALEKALLGGKWGAALEASHLAAAAPSAPAGRKKTRM